MKKATKVSRGYLFKRGKCYYVQYSLDGVRRTDRLIDESNQPITDRRVAEAARDSLLAIGALKNKDRILKAVAEQSKTIEARIAELEREEEAKRAAAREAEEERRALKIKDAWKEYTSPEAGYTIGNDGQPRASEDTMTRYKGFFAHFAEWVVESHKVERMKDITEEMGRRYFLALGKTYTQKTVKEHCSFLKMMFGKLAAAARLTCNPFDSLQFSRGKHIEKRQPFTEEEYRAILLRAREEGGEMGLLMVIGACTGLRLSDAINLDWAEIDLGRGFIRKITHKTGQEAITPIFAVLAAALADIPAELRVGKVLHGMAEECKRNRNAVSEISRKASAFFARCGIETNKDAGRARLTPVKNFHSFRHTLASFGAAAGAPIEQTRQILAHSKSAMTDYYTHSTEAAAASFRKTMESAFSPVFAIGGGAAAEKPARERLMDIIAGMTDGDCARLLAELEAKK